MEEEVYCQICNTKHAVEKFQHTGGGWRPGMHEGMCTNWITLKCLITGLEFMQEWDDFVEDEGE